MFHFDSKTLIVPTDYNILLHHSFALFHHHCDFSRVCANIIFSLSSNTCLKLMCGF